MENCTADQRVDFRGFVPVEQTLDFSRYKSCRRSQMDDYISIKHTYPSGAKTTILRNQAFHHNLMSLQQIFHRIGIKRKHHLICIVSILHFPNFIRVSKDMLSINNGRDLFKGKGIMLDGKRRMNCPYSVFFSQERIQIVMREHFDPTDLLADSSYQVGNLVRHVERRLVFIHVLKHPMSVFTA